MLIKTYSKTKSSIHASGLFLAALALANCATYGEVSSTAPSQVLMVDRGYQAVYADLVHSMRKCMNPGDVIKIEADLFSDLGYGEITVGLTKMPNTLSVTKIEASAGKSKVTIWTGNELPAPAARDAAWIAYWAQGGTSCLVGLQYPPGSSAR